MGHPLFDDNAPKQQTHVPLPVGREGSSKTPFSYRQARRYGQNERWRQSRATDTMTLRLNAVTEIAVDDVLRLDATISGLAATPVSYTSVGTDVDTELTAFAAAIQLDAQYLAASWNSSTKRLTIQASGGKALTNAVVLLNGTPVSVD